MKTREQAARFIELQMHWSHKCKLEKGSKTHYGWQELRELMDFIYEASPRENELLREIPSNKTPNAALTGGEAAGGASELTDVLATDSKRALELLGSIFYCGNFVAQTRNEQELEMLMRKHGYFIETEAQFDAYCQAVHAGT